MREQKQCRYTVAFWMLVCVVFLGCFPSTRRLDEAPMYDGPRFRLKLVRYYENYPLHYTGEIFRVQCSSAETKSSPSRKTQDAGWVSLGRGGAIGSKSAAEVAQRERARYIVIDDSTLVWIGNGVSISFDACGRFRAWYPTSLPEELIVPVEKPDRCKPKGTTDCRFMDFRRDRKPRFDDIRVSPEGHVSFMVRSKALRGDKAVRAESSDFGQTWQIAVVGQDAS